MGWMGSFPPAAAPARLALTLCCLDSRAQMGLSRLRPLSGAVRDLGQSRAGPLKAERVFCSQVSNKPSLSQTSLSFSSITRRVLGVECNWVTHR